MELVSEFFQYCKVQNDHSNNNKRRGGGFHPPPRIKKINIPNYAKYLFKRPSKPLP